jgi:alkanesulfonate monooxygenase SsuD/methylene tetrahydromethanopterin reductase-like flavin-dependent oxidoreductase (luciferase family)
MGPAEDATRKARVLDDHCAAVGREPREIRRTVTVRVLIRDRADEAWREWNRLMEGISCTAGEMTAFTGTRPRIAESLQPYVDGGFAAVIIELPAPYDPETIERLAAGVVPLLWRES